MSKKAMVIPRTSIAGYSVVVDVIRDLNSEDRKGRSSFFMVPIEEFSALPFELMDREFCEVNPNYLQIIPYVTLFDRKTGDILTYRRGKKGQEDRLHDKYSVGLGGHIDELPEVDEPVKKLIYREVCRELVEEIGLKLSDPITNQIKQGLNTKLQLFYSDVDQVGMVHLGIALGILVDKETDLGSFEEMVIVDPQWRPLSEITTRIFANRMILEEWSKNVVFMIASMSLDLKDRIEANVGQLIKVPAE